MYPDKRNRRKRKTKKAKKGVKQRKIRKREEIETWFNLSSRKRQELAFSQRSD